MTSWAPDRSVGIEEGRDLVRVVLAVAVERHDRLRTQLQGTREAGPQRGTLAGVRDLPEHGRTGGVGSCRRVVGRSVIDHDHGQMAARGLHDRGDPRPLLIGRDQRNDQPV